MCVIVRHKKCVKISCCYKNSYFNTEISLGMILIQIQLYMERYLWQCPNSSTLYVCFVQCYWALTSWCPSIGYRQCSSSLLCRVCPVCQLPFNDAAFVRYPNGTITHLRCGRNKTICPITGTWFGGDHY